MAEAWTLPMHAVGVLTACGLAIVLSTGWPLGLGAFLSFSALLWSASSRWTPSGRLGPANQITALRMMLLVALLVLAPQLPRMALVAGFALVLVLDIVDGAVARTTASVSEFGAAFDMEVDALSILAMGYLAWSQYHLGAWVMIPGLLRYAYVLCLAVLPPTGREDRRSQFGRIAFLASAIGLLLALALRDPARTTLAGLATAVSCVSFARSFGVTYPGLATAMRRLASALRPDLHAIPFLLAWTVLNLALNIRYPAPEPGGWYFLPSIDATVLLAGLAVMGLFGLRLRWWARLPMLVLLLMGRSLRLGDGIAGVYFGKAFNVYSDAPQVAELVRYARSTFSTSKFYLGAAGLVLIVAAMVFVLDRALAVSARYFLTRRHVVLFAALALPFVVASATIDHDARYNQRYTGAFAASVVPRLRHELTFLVNVYDHRAGEMRGIVERQQHIRQIPSQLTRLHHANVYLFLVESYGATVLDQPSYRKTALPVLQAADKSLAAHGFTTASARLVSSTYGGMSWLAHATLLTGVRTSNQLQYDLLGVSHPRTLARIAHDAGYRTLLVAPNTNRQSRGSDFYDFDAQLAHWNFDYKGPTFGWASMPDQYVLDYVRRHVLDRNTSPIFATYVLVSSHAPWSHVPTMVSDWAAVGSGFVYQTHPLRRSYTNWPDFSNAREPYLASILYDIEVLRDYLTRFVNDDALVVVLGDHQPVSELTDDSDSWAVPIHIISRNPQLVAPFLARGYVSGMTPGESQFPMEDFLPEFIRDFSQGAS